MKLKRSTKIIHLFIIVTVCTQLFSQFLMFVPTPDKLPETQLSAWLFVIHLCVGIVALCFVAVRLISILEEEADAERLYPWFYMKSVRLLFQDFKNVFSIAGHEKSASNKGQRIASAAHGLAILLLLAMGITGILFFLGLEPDGAMDTLTTFFRSTHEYLAIVLWLFIIGHISMFAVHIKKGSDAIREIFSFK